MGLEPNPWGLQTASIPAFIPSLARRVSTADINSLAVMSGAGNAEGFLSCLPPRPGEKHKTAGRRQSLFVPGQLAGSRGRDGKTQAGGGCVSPRPSQIRDQAHDSIQGHLSKFGIQKATPQARVCGLNVCVPPTPSQIHVLKSQLPK